MSSLHLIEELKKYKYDPLADSTAGRRGYEHEVDHHMDAMRYGLINIQSSSGLYNPTIWKRVRHWLSEILYSLARKVAP